nr:glycerol-3-phosphate dehydrogenase C-terminal domain-containing protein [Mycobacterium tuberculosis]
MSRRRVALRRPAQCDSASARAQRLRNSLATATTRSRSRGTRPIRVRRSTRAEFEYAVTHEGALDVDDILDRRTRIGLVPRDRERVVAVAKEFLSR